MLLEAIRTVSVWVLVVGVLPFLVYKLRRSTWMSSLERGDSISVAICVAMSLVAIAYQSIALAGAIFQTAIALTPVVTVLLLGIAVAIPYGRDGKSRNAFGLQNLFIVGSVVVFLAYGALLVRTLKLPVFGWDNAFYHLPLALRWSGTGNLIDPYGLAAMISSRPDFVTSVSFYPANGAFFHLMALEGWGHLGAKLVQLPFVFIGAFYAYRLALMSGISAAAAPWAGLLFMSAPIVAFQGMTSYSDLVAAVFLMSALTTGLVWHHNPSPSLAGATGLGVGLTLGSKPAAIPFALVMGLSVFVWGYLHGRKKKRNLSAVVFLIGLLLPSMFWFARNWAILGSPVFPVQVSIGNSVIFNGARLFSDKQFQFVDPDEKPLLVAWMKEPFEEEPSEENGVGLPLLALGVTGVALSVINFIRGRVHTMRLLVPLLLYAGTWWLTNHEPRQAIAALGLAAALGSSVLDEWPSKLRSILATGLLVALAVNSFFTWEWFDFRRGAGVEGSTPSCGAFDRRISEVIDSLPDGSRILNDYSQSADGSATTCNYALEGPKFEHEVIWELDPVTLADGNATHDYLINNKIDFVFLRTAKEMPLPSHYAQTGFQAVLSRVVQGYRVNIIKVLPG